MLYFAKIEVEKMDLLWVKSEGRYFLNMRSKVIAPKINIIFFYFTLFNPLQSEHNLEKYTPMTENLEDEEILD